MGVGRWVLRSWPRSPTRKSVATPLGSRSPWERRAVQWAAALHRRTFGAERSLGHGCSVNRCPEPAADPFWETNRHVGTAYLRAAPHHPAIIRQVAIEPPCSLLGSTTAPYTARVSASLCISDPGGRRYPGPPQHITVTSSTASVGRVPGGFHHTNISALAPLL